MCIAIRGKGREKEKGSKLWQSLRKCSLYIALKITFKKREINHKQQTTKLQTMAKPNPTLKKQKAKKCLQLGLSPVQDDADTQLLRLHWLKPHGKVTPPSLLHFALQCQKGNKRLHKHPNIILW